MGDVDVRALARELDQQKQKRVAEIDRRIPQLEQEVAKLHDEKHTLMDERKQILQIKVPTEVLDSGRRGRNGGRRTTQTAATPMRKVSEDEILGTLREQGEPLPTRDLAKKLGVDARTIRHQLPRMVQSGMLAGDKDGWMMPERAA